jgi:YegS/Rv2252/BmrU family lipid kinase
MKYIFLINSFTLKSDINKLIHNIKNYCDENKLSYEIEINNESNSTEMILKKYKKTKYIIFSIGGDGTLNRVINSLAITDNIIGVIPYGTGNDFYKAMKKQFKTGINDCDLIKINDRYFINTACFGIDADIAYNKENITSKLIPRSQKYNASIIKTFASFKSRYFKIDINDKVIENNFATVVVCNGCYYGNGYNIGVNSKLDDDLLDVYLVNDINRVSLVALILKIKNGKHLNDKNIIKLKTNKLTIKLKENVNSNVDGEILEDDKFKIEVLDKKIEVFYDEELIKYIKRI